MNAKDFPQNPNYKHMYGDPPPAYTAVQTQPITGTQVGSTTYVHQTPQPITGTQIGSTTYVHQTPQPTYGTVPIVVQPVRASDVIIVGGCPACRVGVLNERFTLGGLCCAFFFFPIGIIFCLLMTERRCSNCGATFN